ncbi:MAG: (Fe-S)-binding protein [Anaerolineae bacterium]
MNHAPNKNVEIQLFVTCLVDQLYPEVGMAVVEVLEGGGCVVEVPPGQTCCGQPAFNAGFWDDARAMARHTIDALRVASEAAPVVVPSGSCAAMIVHHFPRLLADDAAYAQEAGALAARTYEFSQFLVDVLGLTRVSASCQAKAAYHPSCHLLRELHVVEPPLRLLAEVEGLDVVDLPYAEDCCGFGGLFAVKMSDISAAMLDRKLDNLAASGADTLVGCDISCLMHLAGGLRRRGSQVRVRHLAEVLAGNR